MSDPSMRALPGLNCVGHIYCDKCLKDCIQSSQDPMQASCPTCRTDFPIGEWYILTTSAQARILMFIDFQFPLTAISSPQNITPSSTHPSAASISRPRRSNHTSNESPSLKHALPPSENLTPHYQNASPYWPRTRRA